MAGREGRPNKNKKFLESRLKEMYGEQFDPIIRAADMALLLQAEAQSTEENKVQAIKASVDAWLKIGEFVQPKLKAVEISGTDGDSLPAISVTIVRGEDEGGDTGGV